jgi:hypothetical protein
MWYGDSSNLYSFAGGDPFNRRDPTGKSWKTFWKGVAEGGVNLVWGTTQMAERASNPAAAANPFQKSVNFTRPGPLVVTSVRDPKEEVKAATIIVPIGEMLGRFTGNVIETVRNAFDPTAPQQYVDELHADVGRDTPGVILTVAPIAVKAVRGVSASAPDSLANAAPRARTTFYVTPDGTAIPARGYRALGGAANVAEAKAGVIASRNPTYITFTDITDMTQSQARGILQLPRRPTHVAVFDTLQLADDLRIPGGRFNTSPLPEPLTTTFPEWDPGGGTQAITFRQIMIERLLRLGSDGGM